MRKDKSAEKKHSSKATKQYIYMTITHGLTASAGFAGGFGQSEIVIASFQPYLFFPEHDTVTNSSKLNEIIREIKNT